MASIELDIHTHTIASGHGSSATITDMAKAAASRNLSLLGISDHGPATIGGGRTSYFRNLAFSQRKRLGVQMLYGAEVTILDEKGSLDLPNEILENLDYVIASIHRPLHKTSPFDSFSTFKKSNINTQKDTTAANTAAYIAAMQNPYVSIIGHCSDPKYPIDPMAVVSAAMENHVLLEINNSSLAPNGYRGDTRFTDLMILNLCKHFNYPVILSSDSHGSAGVGDLTYALQLAELAEMPEELILNYSKKALLSFLAAR